MNVYTCRLDTPLGPVTAAAENDALTGLWFAGQKYYPQKTQGWAESPEFPVFAGLRRWLEGYFAGRNPEPEFALNARGSDFQRAVWDLLLATPYGRTTTYGALAERMAGRLGRTFMSAQAVGGAVGHNPISLLIPCHRVLGSNGGLTGYAGGLDKKRALLTLESAGIAQA